DVTPYHQNSAFKPKQSSSRAGVWPTENSALVPKRILVGISGASGAVYATRLIELLLCGNIEVHLVISPYGQRLLHDELHIDKFDTDYLARFFSRKTGNSGKLITYNYRDVGAVIASGSFTNKGMIII